MPDAVPHDHGGKVQTVDTDIQQCTSGEFGQDNARDLINIVAQVRRQHMHGPDLALCNQITDHLPIRHVPCPDGFRDQNVLLLCHSQDFLSLTCIGRERLLTQYRFSMGKAELHMFCMMRMRCRDIDQINCRVLQHRLITSICMPGAFLACKRLRLIHIS